MGDRLSTKGVSSVTTDYLGLLGEVPESERALAARARAIVEEALLPRVAGLYDRGEFPLDVIPRLAAAGLLGASIPGIGNASPLAWGLACLELERGDSGLRSFVSVQTCLAMTAIARFGSDAQRQRWLRPLASAEAIGCFALTEPAHGSDPASLETRAFATPSGYRLSGYKRWATNATFAQIAVIWAQTDPAAGARGIRGFLVPIGAPGVEVRPIERKLSMRMSSSAEILLHDVEVPADALLPGTTGLGSALACLNEARYTIVWGAIGAAEVCYEIALEHVKARQQFGRPLAGFQLVQQHLVEMLDRLTAAQLVAHRLARLKQQGTLRHQQVSFAKRHTVSAAQRVAARARALLGAEGILLDRHIIRHLANLETLATYEGTEQIHTLIVGADVTDQPAFR
ncbi:MAG: acyl-CoA dehydrogenase family protein [Chloroflexi bacterium]|nr:acyl-CoA dehydrogenase family protein [Chloroflexota bacterium]